MRQYIKQSRSCVVILSMLMILSLTLLGAPNASAQSNNKVAPQSIFDVLQSQQPGKGIVRIIQSDAIRSSVGRRPESLITASGEEAGVKMQVYRIQVYSGNRPNSRSVAQQRESNIKSIEPDYPTYVNYNAPFWRLRVGNFFSSQEAQDAMRALKKQFPQYAKEMYIVRDIAHIVQ